MSESAVVHNGPEYSCRQVDIFVVFRRVHLFENGNDSKTIAYLSNHPDKVNHSFALYNQEEILTESKWQLHSMIKSFFFNNLEIKNPQSLGLHFRVYYFILVVLRALSVATELHAPTLLISMKYRFCSAQSFIIVSEKKKKEKTTLLGNLTSE